jgi:hypothetical protein
MHDHPGRPLVWHASHVPIDHYRASQHELVSGGGYCKWPGQEEGIPNSDWYDETDSEGRYVDKTGLGSPAWGQTWEIVSLACVQLMGKPL